MSQKNKMQMPQSSAGLMRYFDQSKESIKIKPEYVVIFSVVIIALEVIFRFMM
ncbi:MAG: preprotein translocase subunit Sec61beta [Nanoarchaeota archaeon]|nr:preprotein translocase subunit Sec61beta [Nanoarchaeota archaeon]MBU1135115.1 preprotein translocase subunit Sec61beta [Nanoarchaeota archaeon]MBU2520273.1 preprotein translocase subunit Sec61beta [Nanoarchaeota archaeon]